MTLKVQQVLILHLMIIHLLFLVCLFCLLFVCLFIFLFSVKLYFISQNLDHLKDQYVSKSIFDMNSVDFKSATNVNVIYFNDQTSVVLFCFVLFCCCCFFVLFRGFFPVFCDVLYIFSNLDY